MVCSLKGTISRARLLGALCLVCLGGVWRAAASDQGEHFTVNLRSAQTDPRSTFTSWLQHVGRSYDSDKDEFERRLNVWFDNLRHLFDSQQTEAQLNGFADISDDDFRATYLGQKARNNEMLRSGSKKLYRYRFVVPLPEVDWRQQGIVGPVKNQHVNGSPYFDEGCQGGDFDGGMQYIIENGGVDTEANYPYLAMDSKCDRRKERRGVVTIDAVEDVPGGNETALMQGVSMHPVGVAVCVGPYIKEWRAYTGGIMKLPSNCEDPLDHAMVVVGYGTTNDTHEPYWILKNAWGDQWGEGGYLKLPRGLPGNGACGLAISPGYPIKTSPNPGQFGGNAANWDDWIDVLGRRAALREGR